MKLKSRLFDLFLILLVSSLLVALFSYTDISRSGLKKTLQESYGNYQKIKNEPAPNSNLNPKEQSEIKEKIGEELTEKDSFCQNDYFPFLPGAKWTYRLTTEGKDEMIELGVPSPSGENRFLDGRIKSDPDWTVRTIFRCLNGNKIVITDLNFLNLFKWKDVITKPCEEEKFFFSLPSKEVLISEDSYSKVEEGCLERIFIDRQDADKKIVEREKTIISREIVSQEKIKIPAGEYEAIKNEVEIKSLIDKNGAEETREEIWEVWLAKEIGILKITGRKQSNELGFNDNPLIIQELVSFQIPTELKYKQKNN